MKRILASAALSAILPVMWYSVVLDKFLPTDNGNLKDYCVTRQNSQSEDVELCYDKREQATVFGISKLFPRRVD